MRRFAFILMILLIQTLITNVFAGERTKDEMKKAALKALSKHNKSRGKTVNAKTFDLKEYVTLDKLSVIGSEDLGFAVVTNDDRFDEVIGYSFTNYSVKMPCGFKWWLEAINEVMEKEKDQRPAKTRAGNIMKSTDVGPLITTKWGQSKPYNNKCKITVNGEQYSMITGCVATAMAQVMNYYKYPTKGKGENSYTIKYKDIGDYTYHADFESSYYDWNNMLDDYSDYYFYKPEDKYTDAVSLLMSDCGKAVNMKYTTYSSGASLYYIPIALNNNFSYSFIDDTNTIYHRNDFSNDDWMNVIYTALNNRHPILYCGSGSGCHMFVIHGYDSDGKVYVNWGWNGSYDGYFMIDMLNPGGHNYSSNQEMIIPVPAGTIVETKYKLSYIVDGVLYKEYSLKFGDAITPEPAPTKEGYMFSGWSSIPQTMPANDVTITGTFTKGAYKLTYMLDGVVYKTVSYDYGATIIPESAPTKKGHTFSGWSGLPSTMPGSDVTVTGSLTINKYKLLYIVDGEDYKTYDVEYGAAITPEPEPTKDGYVFSGWSYTPSTMPDHDVTVIGTFDEPMIYGSIIKYNGLRYKVIDDYVLVGRQDKELSGDIVIPASISCDNNDYPVMGFVEPTNLTAWSNNTVSTEGGAFQDCQITSVSIPSSITKISAGAFSGCTRLTSVILPDNLESIGAASFAGCTALETISIPDGVSNFASDSRYGFVSYTFGNCSKLKTINIPSGITILYEGCFKGAGLESILIPKTIVSLMDHSLALPNLRVVKTEIKDPSKINYSIICFESVSNANLYVPKGSLNVYKEYEPWSNFHSILEYDDGGEGEIIDPSQNNITYNGIKYILKDGVATIGRQDNSLSGEITIPDKISYNGVNYKVTGMVEPTNLTCYSNNTIVCVGGAFQGSSIESISLPSTINTISAGAFQDCRQLKKVFLPETIKQLSAACFAGCLNLEDIIIPEGLTDLASDTRYGYRSYVFGSCKKIKSIEIPSGVRILASGCFLNSGIETVSIPAGCTQMDEDCLNAPSLRKVTMYVRDLEKLSYTESCFGSVSSATLRVPKGSKQVYQEFYPWMSFASIEEFDDGNGTFVPSKIITRINNIRYILSGNNATIGRQNKELSGNIVIPSSVSFGGKKYTVNGMVEPTNLTAWSSNTVSTENGAFQFCPITSITIPSSISVISAGAFYGCQELENIKIAEGVTQLGAACFAGCTKLVEIQIPESVKELGSYSRYGFVSYVFGNCTSLKKVNIPKSVNSFSEGCFKGCGLETFIIPENVKTLEQDCFSMDQLKAIKITHRELDNLKYTESIFNNVSNVSLYVPEGTAKIYREFYPWKKFKEIVEYKNQNDEFLFNAYRVSYILSYSSNSNMSTRDLNNENVYIKTYCASGIDLEDVDAPIIDGYQFAGWSGIPKTMPAHDVTVTGTFNFIGNIKGDINNDGRVNVADIVALNNLIKSSTGSYSAAADLNNDGKVNDADVSILVQMIMGR